MKYYLNYSYDGKEIETIEETDNYKDALYLLKEYRMGCMKNVWISKRATKDWYNKTLERISQ